jgi:hypothetical protein
MLNNQILDAEFYFAAPTILLSLHMFESFGHCQVLVQIIEKQLPKKFSKARMC